MSKIIYKFSFTIFFVQRQNRIISFKKLETGTQEYNKIWRELITPSMTTYTLLSTFAASDDDSTVSSGDKIITNSNFWW